MWKCFDFLRFPSVILTDKVFWWPKKPSQTRIHMFRYMFLKEKCIPGTEILTLHHAPHNKRRGARPFKVEAGRCHNYTLGISPKYVSMP